MTWLITALVATGVLAAFLPALLLLLAVLDPPRTEEGWRRELASTGGLEHLIIADAYCIHHRKGRKDGTKKSSRRKMANGESLSASGSASLDQADSSLREYQSELRDDAHHHAVFCRSSRHRRLESLQGSPGGDAAYKASASSSQPADEQDQNRPADRPERSAGESLQAGSGGRSGGNGAGSEPATFWEKLVENGERLGV